MNTSNLRAFDTRDSFFFFFFLGGGGGGVSLSFQYSAERINYMQVKSGNCYEHNTAI